MTFIPEINSYALGVFQYINYKTHEFNLDTAKESLSSLLKKYSLTEDIVLLTKK